LSVYWRSVASSNSERREELGSAIAGANRFLPSLHSRGALRGNPARSALLTAFLRARVHADAFSYDPAGYLQAVLWRLRGLRVRSKNRLAALAGRSPLAYALWIAREEQAVWSRHCSEAVGGPDIGILVDCTATTKGLQETLTSVKEGAPNVAPLVVGVAKEASTNPVTGKTLREVVAAGNGWMCILAPGDRIAPGALEAYALSIRSHPEASLVYGDDDLIVDGRRDQPHFKPDWNPDLFTHHDFITYACVVRLREEIIPAELREGWACELVKEVASGTVRPVHLPLVLHHRARRQQPVVPVRQPDLAQDAPLVSVIIPTKNKPELLRKCVEGLLKTEYPRIQMIVVDNGSDEPDAIAFLGELEGRGVLVLRRPGRFNYSALNNSAVEHASGELLCFLNNDVEMLDSDWLKLLVRQALRPELGAVGARLLYPDGTVQHAGVVTGIGGGAGHAHRFQKPQDAGYFERARLPQRVTAVTAACLVLRKDRFLAVGGFDEKAFPVAFNDVDLCLKLNERGWQSFYEPRATLIHHESKSRGSDRLRANRERFAGELAALKRKWRTDERRDPFHHPSLSPFTEQFLVSI